MIYGHVWSRSDTFSPTIILGGARVQLNSRFHHLQPGSSNDKHCTTRYGEVFMTFSRGGKKITSGCSNLGIFFVYLPKIVEHKPINNLDSFFLVIFYRLYHGKSPSNHRENPRMMMCFSLGKLKVISSVGNVSFAIVLSLFFCAYFLHVEKYSIVILACFPSFSSHTFVQSVHFFRKGRESIWCFISKKLPVYSISQLVFRHRYYGDSSEYEFWLNSDLAFFWGSFRFREGW